jgi:hypothetical protein
MKHAWIENGVVRDIAPGEPSQFYHPDVAKFYDAVIPDDVEHGATLVDGAWVNLVPPLPLPPPTEPEKLWDAEKVREGLTLLERVNWDNDTTPFVKTAKVEFNRPRSQGDTANILDLLVQSGDISQASRDAILAV